MKIFAIDSSEQELDRIAALAEAIAPDSEVCRYQSSLKALAEARSAAVDVAILETELPELNGLDLGQYLKELYPRINLIYHTGSRESCFEAMALHASGYMLKPAGTDELRQELDDLRHPAAEKSSSRVFAQTFGNFELFVDGAPVEFKYNRTKEIVALLVNNRGAQTTNGEIIASLWEDDGDPDKKVSYLSNLRQDLQNTLKKLRLTDIIVKQRGSLGIAVNRITCDLYDWLEKQSNSTFRYMGDYMNQYSWAETMHAELDDIYYSMQE